MADQEFDRERRQRDVDYDRDWDRDDYGRPYAYPRDYTYDRDYRYGPRYNREYDYDWRTRDTPRYPRGWDYDYDYEPAWTYTEARYRTRGPFTGIGPRGYQRSDDRILEDVVERLMWHGQIDASDINVNVNNGIVTLSGSVNSRREKRMAEDTAEMISGVWDVENRLRVTQAGRQPRGPMRKQIQCGEMRTGMEVVGSNGGHIGNVKEIRDNDFLVDRPMARDLFIPFNACQSIDNRIHLNVTSENVDNQGWPTPELIETPDLGGMRR